MRLTTIPIIIYHGDNDGGPEPGPMARAPRHGEAMS
jgi:hypothetical protein